MSKPAEIILKFAAERKQADEFDKAVMQAIDAYGRVFAQIGYHVNEFAGLCQIWGKGRLLKALPDELRVAFDESLKSIQVLWEALSPEPFPDLPDEAKPVEVEKPAKWD